jgi:hypothetical protein
MKWQKRHSVEWDADYQIELDDASSVEATDLGSSHQSVGDHPFPGVPVMPRDLGEWSAELLAQRTAAALSEGEMKSPQYQDQKDPVKSTKGSKGVKATRAAKGKPGKK